jgi:hypothetical protein
MSPKRIEFRGGVTSIPFTFGGVAIALSGNPSELGKALPTVDTMPQPVRGDDARAVPARARRSTAILRRTRRSATPANGSAEPSYRAQQSNANTTGSGSRSLPPLARPQPTESRGYSPIGGGAAELAQRASALHACDDALTVDPNTFNCGRLGMFYHRIRRPIVPSKLAPPER